MGTYSVIVLAYSVSKDGVVIRLRMNGSGVETDAAIII